MKTVPPAKYHFVKKIACSSELAKSRIKEYEALCEAERLTTEQHEQLITMLTKRHQQQLDDIAKQKEQIQKQCKHNGAKTVLRYIRVGNQCASDEDAGILGVCKTLEKCELCAVMHLNKHDLITAKNLKQTIQQKEDEKPYAGGDKTFDGLLACRNF